MFELSLLALGTAESTALWPPSQGGVVFSISEDLWGLSAVKGDCRASRGSQRPRLLKPRQRVSVCPWCAGDGLPEMAVVCGLWG